tara:strand:+ start:26086 stop:26292 length:207 start_codon:yes stop_codon:yes gene_type:complete
MKYWSAIIGKLDAKYNITYETPIKDLPEIMSEEDWKLYSMALKYPNGRIAEKRFDREVGLYHFVEPQE